MKLRAFLLMMLIATTLCVPAFAYEFDSIREIPMQDRTDLLAINPATGKAAAINSGLKALYIIDCTSGSVIREVSLSDIPSGLAIDPKLNAAIVSSNDGVLRYIDLEKGELIRSISTSKTIVSITMDHDRGLLILNTGDELALFDPQKEKIIKEVPMAGITAIDLDMALGYLLVARGGSSGLSIYDAETFKPVAELESLPTPSSIAVNPSTHIAVLANSSDKSLSIVSLETKELLKTISLPEYPDALAMDSGKNMVLVAQKNTIAVFKPENPVPAIDSIRPGSASVGAPGLVLTLKGSKFTTDSRARFNFTDISTLFGDNSSLTAEVPSSELRLPGDVPVTVTNPSPGGGTSNRMTFSILGMLPVIETVTPGIMGLHDGAVGIEIRGKNFLPNASVTFNGNTVPVVFKSSILLNATIELSTITTTGKYPLTVVNPSEVTLTSNIALIEVAESAQSADNQGKKAAATSSGEGTVVGRIFNTFKEPVEGVTVKVRNISTVTDANGRFELTNVPAGLRVFLIHGNMAKYKKGKFEPHDHFPTLPFTMNVLAGQTNVVPFDIHLHRQKDHNFKAINPDEETVLTDSEHPGVEMRIPKGVKIKGWDGKANEKVSVRTVPPNRLPIRPLPDNSKFRSVYMFYFNKVGGGIPDKPIPFRSPNNLGLLPGQKAVLWYYDESPNEDEAPNDWAMAGTGTVTPDGKYIVTDPGVGIPKFCCGATAWGGTSSTHEKAGPLDGHACPLAGEPVDVTTGYFMHTKTDLHIDGIIPLDITRHYRSRESGTASPGTEGLGLFGKGFSFEYDWWLGRYQNMLLLIKPGNYQYQFDLQADGSYIDSADPEMSGAKITVSGGQSILRMLDGWTYTFDPSGLIKLADRNGNAITFVRRSSFEGGYLQSIITPEGRTVTFNQTWGGNSFRTDSIVDSSNRIVYYTYESDPGGYFHLIKVTYPDTTSMQYQYDTQGRLSGIINENGVLEIQNVYDSNNRVQTQILPDGGVYTFSYDVGGGNIMETTMTAPNNAQTTWGFYDYQTRSNYQNGYIGYKTTPDGTTVYDRYPDTNLINLITDPLGRKTSYTYYPNGKVHTVTDNLGSTTTYEYETGYGLVSKITDTNNNTVTMTPTYDANQKITKIDFKDQLLSQTTVTFNSYGLPVGITDPNQNTMQFYYDNPGKPAELTRIVDALGNTRQYAYDDLSRLSGSIDPNGKATSYAYTLMDRITSVTDPMGSVTGFNYDGKGNLKTVTDAKSRTTRFTYDSRDRLRESTDPLGKKQTYEYYLNSEITSTTGDNLKSITDRKGQTTSFPSYDAMNRPLQVAFQDGSTIAYTYAGGRILSINDSLSSAITYTYNDTCSSCAGRGLDKIASETTPLGTVSYTYDALGRRHTMAIAGQPTVTYEYYANGLPQEINQMINGTLQKFDFDYDDGGRRTALSYFQGASLVTQTTYSFDNGNRLFDLQHLTATALLEELKYEYDPNGNRAKFSRNITQPLPDAIANTSYDDANRMQSFKDKIFTYDDNGNLATITNACGITTFTWDARNRLGSISGFDSVCQPLTASFTYDALNRRIEKIINGTTTQYLYDRYDIIQERRNGTVTANYLRTLNIDEPLMRIKSDGSMRLFKTDALGSIIALTDENGNVTTTYKYDPFGNMTIAGEVSDNPFQYTGRENDGTGLYYYRARYYSPDLQRFISEDPLGFGGGDVNLYGYVGNNPIRFIDPYGLWRLPDYISLNVNVAIPTPWTGTLLGWSGQVALDRYGNLYWAPVGATVGKSATFVSGSLTGGWLNQCGKPSEDKLKNFLSESSFNVGGGFWGGVGETWTPGSGTATEVGFFTPQGGASYHYSWQAGNTGYTW